jgi:hypothetical protein
MPQNKPPAKTNDTQAAALAGAVGGIVAAASNET